MPSRAGKNVYFCPVIFSLTFLLWVDLVLFPFKFKMHSKNPQKSIKCFLTWTPRNTYGVDGDSDRFGGDFRPWNVYGKFPDTSRNKAEWKLQLLLQHFQVQLQIVEGGIATPKAHLKTTHLY